jgi:lysophospholipase L1-like esterase
MRLSRTVAGVAISAAALASVAVSLPSSAAASTGINYAALGDSYSAGVGTGSAESGACDQSPESYAALWKSAHDVTSFDFAACTGATTTDVLDNQLGGLSASTNLVTITVGGDDAGFSSVMETCDEDFWTDTDCLNAVSSAESFVRTTLPGRLDTLFAKIKSDAPNARVIVLGYPEFYEVPGSCSVGLDNTERSAIDGGADLLDTTSQTAAAQYGFTFDDVRSAFAGHEICSSDSWLNSVVVFDIHDSYHPTQDGYADAYLPSLDAITG